MNRAKQARFYSAAMLLQLTVFALLQAVTWSSHAADPPLPEELLIGFKATPNPSTSSFQPLLADSSGNYSLGFLRVNQNQLSLSVLHVLSSVPLWSATTTRFCRWADPTQLLFNGSLVLSDSRSGVLWSTDSTGDRVWISNTSNLVIGKLEGASALWQSFDFPTDTLVENQNFTGTMALVSSNGLYSMQLGPDYFGLYAKFAVSGHGPGQIYLKHRALEAKADIIEGKPIYLVLTSGGYLGIFQNGSVPADVESFNSFLQNVSGVRRVKIEPDGNLKGYYWTGSSWILDYQVITDPCQLPSSCGSYGLCRPGKECSCLENRTAYSPGRCAPPLNQIFGNFCSVYDNRFRVLRKSGVELPFKELMGYKKMASMEECEGACEVNCTCWGVVYSNSSGFCYTLDYPIQTLVAVGDETRMGYFKLRESVEKKRLDRWLGLGLGTILVFGGIVGLVWYKMRRRGVRRYYKEEDGAVVVGPYKDLGAASFRSIELSER